MTGSPRSRTLAATLAMGGLGLVVAAVVLTESMTTGRVASNAADLHWANATMGIAATSRAAVVQANVLLAGSELGLVDTAVAAEAFDEANAHLDSLASWVDGVPDGLAADTTLLATITAYVDSYRLALDALAEQDPADAATVANGPLEAAWGTLRLQLGEAQEAAVEQVSATEGLAALIGLLARIALTLIIPLGAVLTYRYRARRQVQQARADFERTMHEERRLAEAKTGLIAGVSHELRTPLTSIFGFSEVLKGSADPEVAEIGSIVHTAAAALSRMVSDFVTATRMAEDGLEAAVKAVTVPDVVAAVVGGYDQKPIQCDVREGVALADPNLLRHILDNLVANAIQHGGDAVWVQGRPIADTYHLAVSDDGPGIETALLERLFEPFVNEEAVIAGSVGLGLHVARGLAQKMGGDVRYSRRDRWTHFSVVLPGTRVAVDPRAA